MESKYVIAEAAALIGEPTRAAILLALMDGTSRPASELAWLAKCSAQAASLHLAKLAQGGLVVGAAQGRHRYYRLAGPDVSRVLETLGVLTGGVRASRIGRGPAASPLREARTCYDHLAGHIAVDICDALQTRKHLVLRDGTFALTTSGERWFESLGIEWADLQRQRRAFAKPCLDWTERRFHLAGALGEALLATLLQRNWIARSDEPRLITVTPAGRRGLRELLGIEVDASRASA
ncbi:MAG TPA: helix-turn-helix domain-containing protein [Opitutaceae bacterium]|nr:helix-turn-helix domain-containing protein [Opitutaceae bacterium]